MNHVIKSAQLVIIAVSAAFAVNAMAQRTAVKPPVTQTTVTAPPATVPAGTPVTPPVTITIINTCPSGQASRC